MTSARTIAGSTVAAGMSLIAALPSVSGFGGMLLPALLNLGAGGIFAVILLMLYRETLASFTSELRLIREADEVRNTQICESFSAEIKAEREASDKRIMLWLKSSRRDSQRHSKAIDRLADTQKDLASAINDLHRDVVRASRSLDHSNQGES